MNILVVCNYGLYENLSFSFVHNQVREYVRLGNRVRVLIPNGIGKAGRGGGRIEKPLLISKVDGVELFDLRYVTLSRYGEKHFNTMSAISAIQFNWKMIFSDFQPDVIQAHAFGFDNIIGAWLKKKFNCPLVITTHGSDTNIPLEQGQEDLLKAWCDQADRVVAVSHQLAGRLGTCGTSTPISAIHNGFVPHTGASEYKKDPYSIIQVGNLIRSKRVDVTIRAFAKLRKNWPALKLTIIAISQ